MGYKLGPTQINGVKSQISRDHRFECQNRELDCVIRNVLFILINFWDLLSEKETNNIYIYIYKKWFVYFIDIASLYAKKITEVYCIEKERP